MPKDLLNDATFNVYEAKERLKRHFGRDFLNNTDYFSDVNVNKLDPDVLSEDLHVMTLAKDDSGKDYYASEPLSVVLSRIRRTSPLTQSNRNDGSTVADVEVLNAWVEALKSDAGLHVFVNTEKDPNKPKKMEPKFIDIHISVEDSMLDETKERMVVKEQNIEERNSSILKRAKKNNHQDSTGWLKFKQFFSRKETKARLQKEYDDYQALKKSVAEQGKTYRQAAENCRERYFRSSPDFLKSVTDFRHKYNKDIIEIYDAKEKEAKVRLASMVISNSIKNVTPEKYPYYLKAVMENESFKKHTDTRGISMSVVGNKSEEKKFKEYMGNTKKINQITQTAEAMATEALPEEVPNVNVSEKQANDMYIPEFRDYYNDENDRDDFRILKEVIIDNIVREIGPTGVDGAGVKDCIRAIVKEHNAYKEHTKNASVEKIMDITAGKNEEFNRDMLTENNLELIKMTAIKLNEKKLPNIGKQDIKIAWGEALEERKAKSAGFFADIVLKSLYLGNLSDVNDKTKESMKKIISEKKLVKNFVAKLSINDIQNMKYNEEGQGPLNERIRKVINSLVPEMSKNELKAPVKAPQKQKESGMGL